MFKRPVGRPSVYDPKYCDMLIEHMAKGFSFESFAGVVGTCRQTIYTWLKNYPQFLDARKKAESKSLETWEKIMMDLSTGKLKGNAATAIFIMKNRFNWTDRVQEDHLHNGPVAISLSYNPQNPLQSKGVDQIGEGSSRDRKAIGAKIEETETD